MNTATKEKTSTPSVSDERKEEIRDEILDLDEQERSAMEALGEAQEELARVQEEKRLLIQELLEGEAAMPEALELTPEMVDEAIVALKTEFDKGAEGAQEDGYIVQEGMDFAAAETKLRAEGNEAALASLYRMVQAGSRPAVVCEEGGRFCIAETFGQTLSERANCVYDRKAQKQVGRENCNGNAVNQAQKMGVPLMERRIAEAHMAAFPDSDQFCYDYIQATEDKRESGRAPYVFRYDGRVGVDLHGVRYHNDGLGWRGALWI
jgi:hypothetical protein